MKMILSLIILLGSSGSVALAVGEDLSGTSTIRASEERMVGIFHIPISQDGEINECGGDGCGCNDQDDLQHAVIISATVFTFYKTTFYESDSSPLIHPSHSVFRPPITI